LAANNIDTDICISGAGPAGAMAALFLAKKNIPCVLIDKATFPRDKICGDALSGKVANVLRRYDPEILEELYRFPAQVGSWGIDFIAPNLKKLKVPFKLDYKPGDLPPGFLSKRIDFDDFLVEKVRKTSLINFIEGKNITEFEKTAEGFSVSTADGDLKVNAKLLIVADGAHSPFVRQYLHKKPEPKHFSAGLRAYYKNVKGLDKDNFIELHFLKDFLPGYLWIFPLPNGEANVGLGMRSDTISKRKVNLKETLKKYLESDTFKDRFEGAELIDDIKGFGLPLGSTKHPISGDNYVLTGDAGSLIDPFSGEGIGNAMFSGMIAAEQAERSLQENNFSAKFLKTYDEVVYKRMGKEFMVSTNIQRLAEYPWLFNFVVNKASTNKEFRDMFSCMFTDIDLRKKLRQPSFYFRLLFS
jgi:menaquinone-9 beta-reductase